MLDPADPLSIWACTLAQSFNDVVYSNVQIEDARKEWERFYRWRIAVGHYSEACLHLERTRNDPEVRDFLDDHNAVEILHRRALERYDGLRALANRVRNETVFHYPYAAGQRALTSALGDLAQDHGEMGTYGSKRIRDMRLEFADDVLARMVLNASGGSDEAYARAFSGLAEGVAAFAQFANSALEAYFRDRGVQRA